MSALAAPPEMLARLRALAAALIPAAGDRPGAGDLPDFDTWLTRAIRACGYDEAALRGAFALLPPGIDLEDAQTLAARHPEAFAMLSTLVSAAYFMAPVVLTGFGFPEDRRNPAGIEDFMAEFETGIYEPMLAREPMFRDTRNQGRK